MLILSYKSHIYNFYCNSLFLLTLQDINLQNHEYIQNRLVTLKIIECINDHYNDG